MTDAPAPVPLLAQIIGAAQRQTGPQRVNDFIHVIKDVSNAYVVNTDTGYIMINTGFVTTSDRNKGFVAEITNGSPQAIFLTQAHPDHYGGVPTIASTETPIIAQREFAATCDFFKMLDSYLKRRSGVIWSNTIEKREEIVVPHVTPTVTFSDAQDFTFGSRHFRAISTPGGEAPDASIVWMPDDRVAFTGNLFGPLLNSVPNLCTTRGDKPRSAAKYLQSIQTVIDLEPELLIAGHSEPVSGKEAVRSVLCNMRDAVQYIHDKTVEGMNNGASVHELMSDISLPKSMGIRELHGKVSWAVRTIWEEYSGWFHMDSTAALYGTPPSSINTDLLELAGAENVAERALQKALHGQALEAIYLSDIVLNVTPNHYTALRARLTSLTTLLTQANGENMSEVMWLKAQIKASELSLAQHTEGKSND